MGQLSAAVVAAFGPENVTTGVVARLRVQLGPNTPIVVYAGNRAGLDVLRSLPADVQRVEIAGSGGLHTALGRCPDGPVLLTHDDVLFGPDMVARMAEAHAPGRVVVPYLNAPGSGHDVGSLQGELPAALRAAVPRAVGASSLHRIQSSVVLADRTLLMGDGVARHMAAPGALLATLALDFHAARGAVAAHVAVCRQREVEDRHLDGRPLLVATLIVRDEQHMLPDCLASLRPVVDEIVVCDTGSTDRTVEIAQAAGARVVHREWRDDFGWARNQAIEEAGDPWYVVVIDADERLACEDPVALRRLLAQSLDEHRLFEVEIANSALGKEVKNTFLGTRVFRADEVRYEGALHEQPTPLPHLPYVMRSILQGLRVLHVGYDPSVMSTKDKGERNVAIAREFYERERSPQTAMHYARSLAGVGRDVPLQRALLEESLRGGPAPAIASYALTMLAEYDLADGDAESAFARAGEAVDRTPADDLAALVFAKAAEALGRVEAIAEKARWRRDRPSAQPAHAAMEMSAEVLAREAVARAETGDLDGALDDAARAVDLHGLPPARWSRLAAAILDQRPNDVVTLLSPLVQRAGAKAFASLMSVLPRTVTAELAAATAEAGAASAEAVHVGLTAAVLQGRADLVERLAPAARLLDPTVLERIVQRAETVGDPAITATLRAVLPERRTTHLSLRERVPRSVLFLEETGDDPRVPDAVARCAAAVAAQGYVPVRHVTSGLDTFGRAVIGDLSLPKSDGSALAEALRPAAIVFASMYRLNRDLHSLVFSPHSAVMLLVPASPIGPGECIDAVMHPEDPGVEKVLLDLLAQKRAPDASQRGSLPPAEVEIGLTSIVVHVSREATANLDACLRSITADPSPPRELVLVGVDEDHPGVAPLRRTHNVRTVPLGGGPVAERNRGLAATCGEFVCVLDAGYELTAGWLETLQRALAVPGTVLAAPRVDLGGGLQSLRVEQLSEDEHGRYIERWIATHGDRIWPAGRLGPTCLLARKTDLERAGTLDEAFDSLVVATDELCSRLVGMDGFLRVGDGAVAMRRVEPPAPVTGTLGWASRSAARHLASVQRLHRVPCAAVVLSDSEPGRTRRTVQQALLIADSVSVVERGDLEATELAVRGISPGSVRVHTLDWQRDEGMAELVESLPARTMLVLGAGEIIESSSYERNRAELESLEAGPARVRVGSSAEVRVHPPTADALHAIGGQDGPLVESFRVLPAG